MNGLAPEMLWEGDSAAARLFLAYCRAWDHPGKVRLTRGMASALFPNGLPVRHALGARMTINCGDFIGHSIAYGGAYEPLSLSLATRLMEGGGVFVDIGCNVGLYSLILGQVAQVRCISIDGSPTALAALELNLRRNEGIEAVVVNTFLGAKRSIEDLHLPHPSNLGTMRARKLSDDPSHSVRLMVMANTLESMLAHVGWRPVKLLKIDVEGAELDVFRGLDWSGAYAPAHVIMEYNHRVSESARQARELLESHGYVAYTVTGERIGMDTVPPEENCWLRRE